MGRKNCLATQLYADGDEDHLLESGEKVAKGEKVTE